MKWLAIILVACAGCANVAKPTPAIEVLSYTDFRPDELNQWRKAARERFGDDPIIFCAHGGMNGNRWICDPDDGSGELDMATVAKILHDLFPNRSLLLLVCNSGAADLSVPNAWYARRAVWSSPGVEYAQCRKSKEWMHCAWTIWEFTSCGATTQPSN